MEKFFKLFLLTIIFTGCINGPEPLPDLEADLTQAELLLSQTWEYTFIDTESIGRLLFATSNMEPSNDRNDVGGNRGDLFRRRVRYFIDGTYQLQWSERGDYSLGTEGDPNWQPNYGYWELNGNLLIHNKGLPYQTTYTINLTENSLRRTHDRYMSRTFADAQTIYWLEEDVIIYIENFIRVNE